ncbi:MAG: hypothetical protein NZ750_03420 [Anaerolineae bacterium]|nr:hypothetical protein [Anaerolineae bacterium]MDW8171370.1 hypothetical protein [Anaerolineae bacterium]
MFGLFFLLDQLAIGLYFLLLAWGLRQLWRLVQARRELRATHFELERYLARTAQASALTNIVVSVELAIILLGIQQMVVPYLRQEVILQEVVAAAPIRDDGDFATATPAPVSGRLDIEPVAPLGQDGTILLLTPTLTPTPVGTIIPNAPPTEGCSDERAMLQIPANGQRVFAPIPIVGTIFADNFAFAKVEIRGPGTNNTYAVIDDRRQPVLVTSPFSQFIPAPYTPGLYQLRVMVFDITSTSVAFCMVNIYITEPPVTPTPTPPAAAGTRP